MVVFRYDCWLRIRRRRDVVFNFDVIFDLDFNFGFSLVLNVGVILDLNFGLGMFLDVVVGFELVVIFDLGLGRRLVDKILDLVRGFVELILVDVCGLGGLILGKVRGIIGCKFVFSVGYFIIGFELVLSFGFEFVFGDLVFGHLDLGCCGSFSSGFRRSPFLGLPAHRAVAVRGVRYLKPLIGDDRHESSSTASATR